MRRTLRFAQLARVGIAIASAMSATALYRSFVFSEFEPIRVNLVTADWYQKYWPAGNSFVRDTVGAVYETMGSRLSTVTVTA